MADLRYASVRFKDRFAGILRERPGSGTIFEYADAFTDTIGCCLPRAVSAYTWDVGLLPFFQQLAPEGWLRGRQARQSEIDTEDDFGLLLRYGEDCIGAVSIHDPEAPPARSPSDELEALTRAAVAAPRTLSGVQPKLLAVRRDNKYVPAGQTGPADYIAKFPPDDLADLVINEDLSLGLLRILIGAAEVTLAERAFVAGIETPALLVKRFDREADGTKLRLEDFAQILARPRGRDFNGKYNASFAECAEVIRGYSARVEIDVLRFYRRIVAYYLLGNGDCHLKNFSLLETGDGLRLSPAYDVVNTYIYGRQGFDTRFGLRLAGERRQHDQINRTLILELAEEIRLPRPAAIRTLDQLQKKVPDVLRNIPAPTDRTDDLFGTYADIVRTSAERLFADS